LPSGGSSELTYLYHETDKTSEYHTNVFIKNWRKWHQIHKIQCPPFLLKEYESVPTQELDPPKLLEQNFDMFIKRNSEPSQGSDVVIEAACNSDDYNLPQEEQLFEQIA